jgi:hypothetical protein
MTHPFATFCDDFYVNMRLGSQLTLPSGRDTLLHFFDRLGRAFPTLTRFRKNADGTEHSLEEDRNAPSYRWISLEQKRLTSGHVNPSSVEESLRLHNLVLDMAPHHLGLSPLEIDYLDVLFGFDLAYGGNHDEIIAESLYAESPLGCLLEESGARPVDVQPTITVALSDDCRLQGRIDVVTRTNSYQVRTGDYGDDVISVYMIIRRYWGDRPKEPMDQIFQKMTDHAMTLCERHVAPKILKPISTAIASRS